MRKNLHYKVLASVLAIAGLYFYNAPAAWAQIKNPTGNIWVGTGTIDENTGIPDYAIVYGGNDSYNYDGCNDNPSYNNITIKNSTLSAVTGGQSGGGSDATNNTVNIENSSITFFLIGSNSVGGTVSDNKVFITNTDESKTYNFNIVSGGTTVSNEATNNTVTINGNVTATNFIAGGVGEAGYSQVYGNQVIIQSGTVTGNIYGGFASNTTDETTEVYNNNITIKNTAAKNIDADLYGGYADNTQAATRDNTLTLEGWSGSVNSVNNFSDIYINNFTLNKNLIDVGSVSGMEGVTIHLGAFTGDIALTAGDYAVGDIKAATIEWDSDIKASNVVFDFITQDESGNDVNAFDYSLANQNINNTFYITDRFKGGGVYATKFDNESGYSTSHEEGKNYVSITAKVEKSVLADKFIDENGQEHTNTQTPNRILTIGEGFETKVGTVAGVYAAKKSDGTAQDATGGVVNISGSTDWSGTVYAGYSENDAVKDNTINVSENIKANNMSLSGSNKTTAAGTLSITGNGSEFNTISNFKTINFNDVALNTADAALTVNNAYVDGTTINVNSLEGGQNFSVNNTLTLIAGNNIEGTPTLIHDTVTAGLSQDLSVEETINTNGIQLAVKDVSMNGQINLVAENRAVAAAFVNQGTDLIEGSLDTLSRDGNYGVKTFAAVHGNRSKYDVNSDLKINGWSTIVGVGNAAEFADGDEFSWGVFYENGSGNYRTFNEFNNEFFRGDGSLVYNGGGIAARYENASGVYTEGSLRAGMLKSEMDNALRDGSGNYYGYDSESAYYGAHIGVGKIISLSDSSDLDVYGKFFHTYTEGDSFTVAKDKFEFDSITSDRLRVGARVTTNKANAFSTYYGLAYEYEFNGDADMRAQNLKAPTQSLQGSSYMAEVGFNYRPTPDSPWSFDLNMRGYAGEREGASFNVQATYTF